jgi:hypothetical protein
LGKIVIRLAVEHLCPHVKVAAKQHYPDRDPVAESAIGSGS